MLGVARRAASFTLASISEDESPPPSLKRDACNDITELGSLPPPPRTPRSSLEIPLHESSREVSSLTSFIHSLRASRLSRKSARPSSPTPCPSSPPREGVRKSGTFGVRDEDTTSFVEPGPLLQETPPPRPPRRRPLPDPSAAGPSQRSSEWPCTPPASDTNRQSLEEQETAERERTQSPAHLDDVLSLSITSNILSAHAALMLGQSSVMREQADAIHRIAEQSLELGRTVLTLAERQRNLAIPLEPQPVRTSSALRHSAMECRRRVMSLPTENGLTLSLLEEAEQLGQEGFAKLRQAEDRWQRAIHLLRSEKPQPDSIVTEFTARPRSKLRKQKTDKTWYGSNRRAE